MKGYKIHKHVIDYRKRDNSGHGPRHGAAWYSLWSGTEEEDNESKHQELHVEWVLSKKSLTFTITIDDTSDYDIRMNIAVPFVGELYLGLAHAKRLLKLIGMDWHTVRDKGSFYWARRIGFNINLPVITIYPWCNPTDWSRGKRNYIYVNITDRILGRRKYSEGPSEIGETSVLMPEGSYKATYKKYTAYWKRPRYRRIDKKDRVELNIQEGIPFPGKGENAWDIGDDACFGMTCSASSIEEAVEKLQQSVTRDRERYGGPSWVPERI